MKVSKKQIAAWIEEYLGSEQSTKVKERRLSNKLIHRLQCDRKKDGVNVSAMWLQVINDHLHTFDCCQDFKSIIDKVRKLASDIYGIGELTIYDTATCIGCPLGVYPDEVFIHAGTKVGARALDVKGNVVSKDKFVKVCKAFEKLSPIQIEDFLCIYSSCLSADTDKCNKISKTGCGIKTGGCRRDL